MIRRAPARAAKVEHVRMRGALQALILVSQLRKC